MASGNVFRRYLEIILDKASATKTEKDAQSSINRATDPAKATKNLSAFFTSTTRFAAQATAALAGYAYALNKLVDRGGEFLNIQRAFTNAVGDADAALTKLRNATGGLISDYDLMVGFNKTLALGAVTNVEQFGQMASVAQRLGKALGIDATTAMERLSLGIARHSPKILDDLGIIASKSDSVAEILAKASAKADEFGQVSLTNADRLNRIKVGFTNLKDEIAKFLATSDSLNTFFFETGNVLEALTLALQSHDAETVKEAFKEFGTILGSTLVAAFADALHGIFDLLSFEKSRAAEHDLQHGGWLHRFRRQPAWRSCRRHRRPARHQQGRGRNEEASRRGSISRGRACSRVESARRPAGGRAAPARGAESRHDPAAHCRRAAALASAVRADPGAHGHRRATQLGGRDLLPGLAESARPARHHGSDQAVPRRLQGHRIGRE